MKIPSERVLVGMASIPERSESLRRSLASLAPQADKIVVALNGYDDVPEFVDEHDNVAPFLADGDRGDAEKFAAVDAWEGFVATCDDDLVYPPDYIETLIAGIERYGRNAVVGFHGGKTLGWNGKPVAATHKSIRCLAALDQDDADVNVLGTGAMGWHGRHVAVWPEVFRSGNMADVYFATHARTFGIPMVALAHEAGWLTDITPVGSPSIYASNASRDGSPRDTTRQRQLELERFDWSEPPPPRPRVRVSIATCARAHLLPDLIADLRREAAWVDIEVAVFEDPTETDYSEVREEIIANGWEWHSFDEHLGRQLHSRLVDEEFALCRDSDSDWFMFLPDDVRLVRHAIPRAITTWQLLAEPATLTLWRLKDQEGQMNWTGRVPERREHAFEIFHVDGIYLCRRETLDFLGYSCPGQPAAVSAMTRARRRRGSSGVGRSMSLLLHRSGKRMYRVERSLAIPVPGEKSVMNPDAMDRRYPGVVVA